MDERCKTCPWLCKRLDPDDKPARYVFSKLSPEQVVTLILSVMTDYGGRHYISVEQAQRSTGNQLAVLLQVQYMPSPNNLSDMYLTFIAQAESHGQPPTEMWFRYGVPQTCCDQHHIVSELTALVEDVVETLSNCDSLLKCASAFHSAFGQAGHASARSKTSIDLLDQN